MSQTWGSTTPGKLFTSTQPWSLTLDQDRFRLVVAGKAMAGAVLQLEDMQVEPGAFWASVRIAGKAGQILNLDGIPNDSAKQMEEAIAASIAVIRRQAQIASLVGQLPGQLKVVTDWVAKTQLQCQQQFQRRGWLSREFVAEVGASKPQGLERLLAVQEVSAYLARQDTATRDAVGFWRQPFDHLADGLNQRHLVNELDVSRPFFNTVEKSPLSPEQAEAVICFDNRLLLIASAGSGKTSTMVAKAGYALDRGYFEAEKILLLAFNNDAAAELRERIKARLSPLGLPAERINAMTFHAFGLEVIGQATGKKPSLAPWLESGRDAETLLQMVDELKDSNPAFRTSWDLFRVVFGQDLPKFGQEAKNPEAWDGQKNGFRTLKDEVVKSRGEVLIANWLFYNGVDYVYEAPYQVDTADAEHRQYRPDFYIPAADAYLEHWALDARGEPPPEFIGYKEGMTWKRGVHAANQTKLLETTMAGLWSGEAFGYLEHELRKLGVDLDPNPDREAPGRRPMENQRLVRTMRSFLTHAKSNRLTLPQLRKRLQDGVAGQFRFRHEMFLNIFERLWEHWEARLREDRCIDFEDMLNQAVDCIESGRWSSPYELVMVDEFQDASQARARLVAGLVKDPGRYLFAVGDDWQSINRFAGADLSVMTDFEAKFGKAVTMRLETTFRCPQALCDVSSQFVLKNPAQLRKHVRSARPDVATPIRIISARDEALIRSTIAGRLAELAAEHDGTSRPTTVYVLGRYTKDSRYTPPTPDPSRLQVEFMTVHSSKGLEADHVIVPRLTSEVLGFPSRVVDDPVLQLAMPGGDGFEQSEERRLFYVALTRARQTVSLVTVAKSESPFITELVRDFKLEIVNADGTENTDEVCPKCGTGFMVARKSSYGPFLGCSNFPRCDHKKKVIDAPKAPHPGVDRRVHRRGRH